MKEHFLLDPDQYVRDLNIVRTWMHDQAHGLVLRRGKTFEEQVEFCRRVIGKDGKFPIKNPLVTIIDKDKNGDRFIRQVGYLNYLKNIVSKDLIQSPSMTTYVRPSVLQSEMGLYINGNLGLRNEAKEEALLADMSANGYAAEIYALIGDPEEEGYVPPPMTPEIQAKLADLEIRFKQFDEVSNIKNNEQTSHKIFNNGISGMQTIGSTPFVLVSAHSSLTSGCRSAVSYGNATIERFVAGSRHYWSPEVVIAQILSITRGTDYEKFEAVMKKYGLHYPTYMETMEAIKYSTDLYWHHQDSMEEIGEMVQCLSPAQRAAFVYTGDMYHLRKFNEDFMRGYLDELSLVVRGDHPDPLAGIKKVKGDHKALALILCSEVTAGKSLHDLIKEQNLPALSMVTLTFEHIMATLDKYHDLIGAMWTTLNVPPNISRTRDIRRRSVVGSDTDSCLFTVREWVKWKNGKADFDAPCQATWHTVVFLACQVVTHSLACLSAGMGVRGEDVKKLAMKNEFAFSYFGLTNIAKHYTASMIAKEGGVYKKAKKEIKGVQFKDSNSAPEVISESNDYIESIMGQIYEKGTFEIMPIFKSMAHTEHEVLGSIRKGDTRYLKSAYVRPKEDYKKPMSSNYFYYEVWEKAFAHKYGNSPSLPYRAVKIQVDLPNKTSIRNWVESIQDPIMRAALDEIYVKGDGGGDDNDLAPGEIAPIEVPVIGEVEEEVKPDAEVKGPKPKTSIKSFLMPLDLVRQHGIPEEILQVANLRRQVHATVSPFYLTAETLGFPMINSRLTNMLHDTL